MQAIEKLFEAQPDIENINESQLIEDMTSLETAVFLPSLYVQVLAGAKRSAVDQKEMGFIIRRSDIHAVRLYVKHAKLLPLDINVVSKALGHFTGGMPELSAKSILDFHQNIVKHANTWGALERATKELSRELNTYSDEFLTIGNNLLEVIGKVELGRFLNGTLDELTVEEKEKLTTLFLNNDELAAVRIIKAYVLEIKKCTTQYMKKVLDVGAMAAEFERVLSNELIHQASRKIKAHKDSGLYSERKELAERLSELEAEIEELIADYKYQVGYSVSGVLLGPVGLLVTGGIFGAKAESTRARKNELIAQRKNLLGKHKKQELLASLLADSQQSFVDLRGRMLGAEKGAKQLASVWDYIAKYLDEAAKGLERVDTVAKLHQFKIDFGRVLNPWRRVNDYTVQISDAFNDVLDELKD